MRTDNIFPAVAVAVAVSVFVFGCDGDTPDTDAGPDGNDAGAIDAGRADAGAPRDGGGIDSGPPDAGCPAGSEDGVAACDDGCDNDGDGQTDCDDTDCGGVGACDFCFDLDGDGRDGNTTECALGGDFCDDDGDNWTSVGCTECLDHDADGYGPTCDRGVDCHDGDATVFEGCLRFYYAVRPPSGGIQLDDILARFRWPELTNEVLLPTGWGDGVTGWAVSPDGRYLVVSGTPMGESQDRIDLFDAETLTFVRTLFTASPGNFASAHAISDDGAWVAFRGGFPTISDTLYVVPTDGSAAETSIAGGGPGVGFASPGRFRRSRATGTIWLVYAASSIAGGGELWSVPLTASGPGTAVELTGALDVVNLRYRWLGFDGSDRVYFAPEIQLSTTPATEVQLYRVPLDGLAAPERVGTDTDVAAPSLTPAGDTLAYASGASTRLTATATVAPMTISPSLDPGATGASSMQPAWITGASDVVAIGDWTSPGRPLAYRLSAAGPDVQLVAEPGHQTDVYTIVSSDYDPVVLMLADWAVDDEREIYLIDDLTTADQAATAIRVVSSAGTSDQLLDNIQIVPRID